MAVRGGGGRSRLGTVGTEAEIRCQGTLARVQGQFITIQLAENIAEDGSVGTAGPGPWVDPDVLKRTDGGVRV